MVRNSRESQPSRDKPQRLRARGVLGEGVLEVIIGAPIGGKALLASAPPTVGSCYHIPNSPRPVPEFCWWQQAITYFWAQKQWPPSPSVHSKTLLLRPSGEVVARISIQWRTLRRFARLKRPVCILQQKAQFRALCKASLPNDELEWLTKLFVVAVNSG